MDIQLLLPDTCTLYKSHSRIEIADKAQKLLWNSHENMITFLNPELLNVKHSIVDLLRKKHEH